MCINGNREKMKKIIAFAGSNHSTSINQKLVEIAAQQVKDNQVEVLNISKLSAPVYSQDLEENEGWPLAIIDLMEQLQQADGLMIAIPEHNGYPPAFFKNIIDWMSRKERKFFGDKPTLLLSTSPGGKGGANSLNRLVQSMPHWGAQVVDTYSLGGFYSKIDKENGEITDAEEQQKLTQAVALLEKELAAAVV